jgi:hypothetical protein
MFGSSSYAFETEENQAWLEYYDKSDRRIKYTSAGGSVYRTSTPHSVDIGGGFRTILSNGNSASHLASAAFGIAPAFCVAAE